MKVLVADSQPSVRHALSVWINGQLGWVIVGESSDASDLLDKLIWLAPELIIMDSDLPGMASKELVTKIRHGSKEVAIIFLYNSSMEQFFPDKLDVDFYASKIDPPARILETFLKADAWFENKSIKSQNRS